jgi:hypothetical protein
MFSLVIASLLLSPQQAESRTLQWSLDCNFLLAGPPPVGAPRVQVTKSAFKNRNGKWDARYAIVVRPINPTVKPKVYELEHAGSGDEDYNEFKLAKADERAIVQGAYIQNQFRWVTVIDREGYGAWQCR